MTHPALLLAALLRGTPATDWVISAQAKIPPKFLIMLAVWVISFAFSPGFRFSAAAESLSGLPYLTDADTITISGTRIRLAGIDAPEMAQTCLDASGRPYRCGEAAREALTAYAAGKVWTCELLARPDRYGRRVGTCAVALSPSDSMRSGGVGAIAGHQQDIQRWLVQQGWALDYRRYSRGRYAKDETEARAATRGLWSGAFHAPWNWRHRTCATPILGAYSVPIDAREKLCRPPPKHPRKRRM